MRRNNSDNGVRWNRPNILVLVLLHYDLYIGYALVS